MSCLRTILIVPALAMAACATSSERVRIVEKAVPVATRPIAAADVPAVPGPMGKRPATAAAAADALLAKLCGWVNYGEVAQQLLALAAGLPAPARLRYPECGDRR